MTSAQGDHVGEGDATGGKGPSGASIPGYRPDDALWGESTTGPDELQVAPAIRASRFPRWALLLSAILAAVLVLAGAGVVAWRINTARPQVVVTASAPRTPWQLVPPLQVGSYSRDANADDTPSTNPATRKSAIATTYARNGQNTVVLLMSRPETDARKFLTDLGMNAVVASGDGWCGTSIDTNHDACALVRDDTAIAIVDLAGLTRSDLWAIDQQFATALAGR